MPAMHYTVQWPDHTRSVAYSPSLVIRERFVLDQDYPLAEFLSRLREATAIANQRVAAKFGFACSRASDQLDDIERRAAPYADRPGAVVRVVAFGPAD
jgi:uncharacterized repeat protein (TIGR04042 family)